MKVYLAIERGFYDWDLVLGIYSTRNAADAALVAFSLKDGLGWQGRPYVEEYEMDTANPVAIESHRREAEHRAKYAKPHPQPRP